MDDQQAARDFYQNETQLHLDLAAADHSILLPKNSARIDGATALGA